MPAHGFAGIFLALTAAPKIVENSEKIDATDESALSSCNSDSHFSIST
ncbi:hypothetical protein ACFWMR_15695 [Amycolatopsis thailandensis]